MNAKTSAWVALAAVLTAAQGAQAQDAGKLTIAGSSTVRSWSCEVPHSLTSTPEAGSADAVLSGAVVVKTLTLDVDVAAIECGNGTMNNHLRKALKAGEHPGIRYQLSSYDLARAEAGATVVAQGTLTIAGSTLPITMDVMVKPDGSGALRATGQQEIVMSQFGVKPPTLMMGTMKVGDAVRVSFDVVLDD